MGGQALVLDVEGTWRELAGIVNKLAANLTNQVRKIAKVTKVIALDDLWKQIDVDARGEILDLKNTVNGMVIRLRPLATRVLVSPSKSVLKESWVAKLMSLVLRAFGLNWFGM